MSSLGQIGVVVTAPPETEPIDLADAKLHLRVTHNEEDVHIGRLIKSARAYLEKVTGRAFITQSLRASYEDFPRPTSDLQDQRVPPSIELPRSPADPDSVEITYLDDAEVEQTLDPADYVVDADALPSRVRVKWGSYWPVITRRPGVVRVAYDAGVDSADDVEDDAKHAIRLLVSELYEHREPEVTGTIVAQIRGLQRLIGQLKIPFPQ